MSMIGHLVAVSQERLEQLGELGDAQPKRLADELVAEFYDAPDIRWLAGVDWQVLNYLLTGDPMRGEPPLGLALGACMEHLCDQDRWQELAPWKFGPPMFAYPDEVEQVAVALGGVNRAALRQRFTAGESARLRVYAYSEVAPEREAREWAHLTAVRGVGRLLPRGCRPGVGRYLLVVLRL